MGRPKKEDEDWKVTRGRYNITKPNDQYVVRLGDDVVYASPLEKSAHDYLDLVKAPK